MAIPISIIKPIIDGIDKLLPVIIKPTKAPPIDKGSAISMVNGCNRRLNNNINTPKIQTMPTDMAITKPLNSSAIFSACPCSIMEIDAGKFCMVGVFLTACTSSPSSPLVGCTVILMARSRSKRLICAGPVPKFSAATSPTRTPCPAGRALGT